MSKTGKIVETIREALLHSPLQKEGLEALDQIVDKVVELAARPLVRIIRNDEQHQNALAQIARLMQSDPPAESVDGELLAMLALVVEDYEKKNFPVGVADWHRRSRESLLATNAALVSGRVALQPSTKPAPPLPPLTRNAARCNLCGETIESKHRHDFVTCKCGNVSVDGGLDYTRRAFKSDLWTDLSEPAEPYARSPNEPR